MKRCPACQVQKLSSEFGINRSRYDGLQTECKSCRNTKAKEWTSNNGAERYRRTKKSKEKLKKDIYEYLLTKQCVDCGESRPECLDFDHDDTTTKVGNVSQMVGRGMRTQVFKEIEKCTIRCANCHRVRTAKQFGWYASMRDGLELGTSTAS